MSDPLEVRLGSQACGVSGSFGQCGLAWIVRTPPGLEYSWLNESVRRLAVARDLYMGTFGREARPVLCIIFATRDLPIKTSFQRLRDRVQDEFLQRGLEIRVEYILEASTSSISCGDISRLIFG